MLKHLLMLFAAVCVANAQVISMGGCPKIAAKQPFNWQSFSGKWYGISKIPNLYEGTDKCITDMYTGSVPNIQLALTRADMNTTVFKTYNATLTANANDGFFMCLFSDAVLGISVPTTVIETDYSNYAVFYACWDFLGFVRFEFAWIKSRARFLLPPFSDMANTAYDKTKLSRSLLIPTDQFNCPLFY